MKEDNLNKDSEIIEPFIIVDLAKVKEKLNSISKEMKKSCSEIKKEVMVRYGGDGNFEDPIEELELLIFSLEEIFNFEKKESSTCITVPLPEDFPCAEQRRLIGKFKWGSFEHKNNFSTQNKEQKRNPISKRGKSKK